MNGWTWAAVAWPATVIALIVLVHWAGGRRGQGDRMAALLRDYKPPAAGTVPPPLMARNGAPASPDPLPGPAPGPVVQAEPPPPGHTCGPVTAALGFNEEGCIHIWNAGGWVARKHARHMPFDEAAWEAKLDGCGPRDGESYADWQRRCES